MTQRKGFVLITVLWILLVLSLLALGLTLVSSGELSLVRIGSGRLRAYAAARAGVVFAEQGLVRTPSTVDTLGKAGIDSGAGGRELVFNDVPLGEGERFSVGARADLYVQDKALKYIWGVSDEAGRFNVNSVVSMDSAGAAVFEDLVEAFEPGMGRKLTEALVAFRSSGGNDEQLRRTVFPEELLLLQGMTPALFKRLKNFVTVHPLVITPVIRLNLSTAPMAVVSAVFKGVARQQGWGGNVKSDVDTFLQCRQQAMGSKNSAAAPCALPQYLSIYELGPFRSGMYRIRSTGWDDVNSARAVVEEVVEVVGKNIRILSWHRE